VTQDPKFRSDLQMFFFFRFNLFRNNILTKLVFYFQGLKQLFNFSMKIYQKKNETNVWFDLMSEIPPP